MIRTAVRGQQGVAALVRGRKALCCDLNPIGVLAAFTAFGLIYLRFQRPEVFEAIHAELNAFADAAESKQTRLALVRRSQLLEADELIVAASGGSGPTLEQQVIVGQPAVDRLADWYEAKTLESILRLRKRLLRHRTSFFLRLAGMAMLSAISRQLSAQTRSWGHIADNVLPSCYPEKSVARAARQWLGRTFSRLQKAQQIAPLPAPPCFSAKIVDWSKSAVVQKNDPVRLLVTSPPYAGAIDYALAQRLSLYLTGHDDESVAALCRSEFGARRKRFIASHVSVWADDLVKPLERQLSIVSQEGHAAFVMPHKDSGREVGEGKLKDAMQKLGWSLTFSRDRSIRQVRARQTWTSIKRESVLVFSRV